LKLKLERKVVMKKLYGIATLAATLMVATLLLEKTPKVAAAAPQTAIKNVVLVHGAFADGSGWNPSRTSSRRLRSWLSRRS
jgi:hypothetical protein